MFIARMGGTSALMGVTGKQHKGGAGACQLLAFILGVKYLH